MTLIVTYRYIYIGYVGNTLNQILSLKSHANHKCLNIILLSDVNYSVILQTP